MKKRARFLHKQRKHIRKRFFVILAAAQAAANLDEQEAEQLAAEAVQAVRRAGA